MFVCARKDDAAGLIASYSPTHRNWKQIGEASAASRKTGDDQKGKLLFEVRCPNQPLQPLYCTLITFSTPSSMPSRCYAVTNPRYYDVYYDVTNPATTSLTPLL